MKLHLGLLVVLAGLAMGQKGRCPNTKECDLKGGACFPRRCPRGLVKIGSCGRSCACCSEPVEDLVPVRPSEGFSCGNAGVCATIESCHHWQKKDKELNNTRKGSAAYKKLIHEYRSARCNIKEKALCCPEKGSGGLSQEGCFPGPLPNACPPTKNLRIVNQKYYDYTRQKTADLCWQHCKELASNSICNAWTYDTNSTGCFTYNTFPACYNTEEYEGWISGRDYCEEEEFYYPDVKVTNSRCNTVSGGVKYAGPGIICGDDTFQLGSHLTYTTGRGACLITEVYATSQGKACTSYTSSGTSHSEFSVVEFNGGCYVTRIVT